MFDSEFRTASFDDGRTIEFTEAESRLLEFFSKHPNQTLTRNQILDGISQVGSERTDRSVDFLINRIRRKLDDNPKDPRFIATRYGGGYIWVGASAVKSATDQTTDAYVVIGELKGLENLAAHRQPAHDFAQTLTQCIQDKLDQDLTAVFRPQSAAVSQSPGSDPSIQVEMVFFQDNTGVECILSCWSGTSRAVYLAKRFTLGRDPAALNFPDKGVLQSLASEILSNRWRCDVAFHLSDTPLPVAMQEAAVKRFDSRAYHKETAPQLLQFRADYPDDPHIKLVHATHIHSDYVLNGMELALKQRDRRSRDEAEIERLVLETIDYAQSQPHLAVMAAKLLYFVDRGYKSLAAELSETAHASSTSIAPSLAIFGQFKSFLGETDVAISYLKQALAFTRNNINFERYVLIMLCQALVASNRRDELEPFRTQIFGHHPLLRVFLEPFFTDPDQPSLRARGAVMVMSRTKMNAMLSQVHYVWARLYEDPAHRANAIRAPLNLAIRRFGPNVVPVEIKQDIPQFFA